MNSIDTKFDAVKFRYDIAHSGYTHFYLTLQKYMISHLECNIHQIQI